MPHDIMRLVINKNKVIFMEGTRVDFLVILSFGALFGYFNGLQSNMTIFISPLNHDKLLFYRLGVWENFNGKVEGGDFTLDW